MGVGLDLSLLVMSIFLIQRALSLLCSPHSTRHLATSRNLSFSSDSNDFKKGKLLVLGGTGFLGQAICKRAAIEGYSVVSVSRRGQPQDSHEVAGAASKIDYRQGDARQKDFIANILEEGDFAGVVHCIGLLFDEASGLGSYNRFVSGSGSIPDSKSTYDTITRLTAFNAIDAAVEYSQKNSISSFPFCFTSAAEAGWPEVAGGEMIERLAPDFLKRYLAAKRAVESKLMDSEPELRPIIVRPSLIYSMDRPASFLPVGAFFVGNRIGLPFVDQPVTVQTLASAVVRAIGRDSVKGKLRYTEIDRLGS